METDGSSRSVAQSRRRALRGLFHVHRVVSNNKTLASLIDFTKYDPESLEDISADEAAFLDHNDLASGRTFDAATLSIRLSPTPPQRDDALISTSKHTSPPAESAESTEEPASTNAPALGGLESAAADATTSPDQMKAASDHRHVRDDAVGDAEPAGTGVDAREGPEHSDEDAVPLAAVAEPLPEDEARLSQPAEEVSDQQHHSRPAKVVHLPPRKVQEENLRDREAGEEQRRSDVEGAKSQRLNIPNNELASSPSSTVGAYSVATPGPPQDSPDTSPDSDSAPAEVPPPKDLQPSLEEQRETEEHDRLLAAQKEIARQEALGDVATPDDQLRWEEREAAAREAEERAAREDQNGPEPDTKDSNGLTEAGQAVEEMEADAAAQPEDGDVTMDAEPQIPDHADGEDESRGKEGESVEAKEVDAQEAQTDEADDTITVAPRVKASLQIDTSSRRSSPAQAESQGTPATSRREGMQTRVSSGAIRQKSVSEILGQTQSGSNSPTARKASEAISPLTRRHLDDNSGRRSAESTMPVQPGVQTTHPIRAPTHRNRASSTVESAIEQLQSLKGAAEDPERDYLEPLFRIQAHETPNHKTKALPDLVKEGSKTISTEDHYTAIHERLDFRMLRRIYQLQNANKWSLRQMEKCKEPEQPVCHLDRMMAEMKWMRKDFKAERKMKKNVCAWLAERCAEWVAADGDERKHLQVKAKAHQPKHINVTAEESSVPELEHAGDSAAEDDALPPTPRAGSPLRTTLVIPPELVGAVQELQKSGELSTALKSLPKAGCELQQQVHKAQPTAVSKFVRGKILPQPSGPSRKRSRYDYDDEAEVLEMQPSLKRMREELPPEVNDCALFHADNKPVRDRLHSNNAFRPPSEFLMPSIAFYEYRTGSQWIWEDDQKLRKLAKEYSFNWSLIADEMSLPTRYKSSAERRTPWECFERWVELESLPADMRKTVYFKTWFNRLETSQQASERRYQANVAASQQQAAQDGVQRPIPPRRRTVPTRVEKRRSARYIWMVDAFKRLAKKREVATWKSAETARAAAQRKTQTDNTAARPIKMTPQEFSKKRHERDLQLAEMTRQARQKMIDQQRNLHNARQAQQQTQQQGMPNGVQPHQRQPGSGVPMQPGALQAAGQQAPNGLSTGSQPVRTAVRAPAVNGQGIPQAQMQARPGSNHHPNMQMAHANGQVRNPQYAAQQFQMANGNMQSPGGMSAQQQLAHNQAAISAAYPQQQQPQSSPSMPPPPTPQGGPQQLSNGATPIINSIKTNLRAANPNITQEQLDQAASLQLKQYMASQARQNAMNAAAGIATNQPGASMQQQPGFPQTQAAFQGNRQMQPNGIYATATTNGEGNGQTPNMITPSSASPQQQSHHAYNQNMQQYARMKQMQMQSSPSQAHAALVNGGSPAVSHPSPGLAPASPSLQQYPQMTPMVQAQQRPSSRSATPQMQRIGSSGSGVNGMQSPGALQGSPRTMQAGMARS